METPEGRGIKVYLSGPGHMTKIAATPIYGIMASQIGFRMHLNGNFLEKLIFQYLLKPVINPMLTATLANSEDTDEMQHFAAFYQGLHCLL